jgi:multidrug efflux system outer membrane protein
MAPSLAAINSDISQAYFELLGVRLELEIAKETTESFAATLKLFTVRQQEGIGNALQTSRAAADLTAAVASVPELERRIALKENQISVVMGKNPGAIETKVKLLEETLPPEVPAGLPSALLERRPDVLSATERVRSANAQIGVAKSAYFPTIGLTTFFGKLRTPLADLASGNKNAWTLGANAAGPIFLGGPLRARNRQAVALWEQARAEYLQAALSAFRDVSDALISRERYDAIREEQIRTVQSSQEALRLARMRYLDGLSSYFEVLEAQQQLYPAQLALPKRRLPRGWSLSNSIRH